jgi:hypothetical protein
MARRIERMEGMAMNPEDCLAPSVKRLISNAERILEMAEDLRAHDLRIEALQFAVIAAQHLQAARSLQRIYDLTAPLGKELT